MKKDWKTTVAGLVAVSPMLLQVFGAPLTQDQAAAVQSVGLMVLSWFAKDK